MFNHPRLHGSQTKIHKGEKKLGITCMQVKFKELHPPWSFKLYSRTSKGLSVGVLLTAVKCKIGRAHV